MDYEKELQFYRELMTSFRLNTWIFTPSQEIPVFDLGLRDFLYQDYNYTKLFQHRTSSMKPNTLYWATDEFDCHYVYFILPPPREKEIFILGPYLTFPIDEAKALCIAERHQLSAPMFPQFQKYYNDLTLIPAENQLLATTNTLGVHLWGNLNNFSLKYIERGISSDFDPTANTLALASSVEEDSRLSMLRLESRYDNENQLIKAVSQGLTHKAEMFFPYDIQFMEQRIADPLRNAKNYMIIANTMLRKAAEAGAVHPLHIDALSSRFAIKIEHLVSPDNMMPLFREMVRKYCLLVKNHSLKGYSLLIRKVLTRIDSDLTADHSLKTQAELLNINASYLSSLFKKETGMTLTEYTNRKRVEHAVFLLNTTTMQVQVIAQYCGIPDVNYFTKTFKKYIGKTPKEYRDELQKYSTSTSDVQV